MVRPRAARRRRQAEHLSGGRLASTRFRSTRRCCAINPLHPGANHELVHIYEGTQRPALGWPHAEKYIESSPGIPHAWHMQAHLAMRLGKWDKTTDRSASAIEWRARTTRQ